ncbi:uncharacterized protein MELLADRAFT_96062 [Melampsora larici-populina 98AG31]|uniref:Peptidase M1 leukotriene A4 hydrolase/aminopeptidase C-terminal domain-containing protein n=1 Tax=Melampsora larici-populina (strain 98AG31 / pathotype 3-4-7) TaxID=747676 RepID=F4SAU0_MELLP|nr:uncharacterized protein MELLADRAFT_96062 [Melampsora larici-populina 98AG31]EGF98245.1 hypothetical protein MELLADRAFT_96062 [Melampsora larici-populina 98AG31]
MSYSPPQDPASFSNYREISIIHAHFDWTIDWEKFTIDGSVAHTFKAHSEVKEIILDTSYLIIHQVSILNPRLTDQTILKTHLGDRHEVLGSPLTIELPNTLAAGDQITLQIKYTTTDQCTAIGWLDPAQTASGQHPFLYSQCQAIHARSLVPIQDTPSVKFTYTALAHSYLPVLFSGLNSSETNQAVSIDKNVVREWRAEQPVKIPSYLVAISAGQLVFRSMGKRTGVWADPATIDAAYDEFATSTEGFVAAAEKIIGVDYDWGRFDVLVLPPSFPYGGMENSNLTFLTPSLLTGDKSLVDVVAHEISHSWFGNNVGCANWGSFWLNEGFTTYLERLILRELHGDPERSFSYIIGKKALNDALREFKDQPRFQQLEIEYEFGEDPDLAFSTVPYDKGANFLLYLEQVVGGLKVFLPYVGAYVRAFKGKSLDTKMWKAHLLGYFSENDPVALAKLESVDWEAWLHGQGLELPVELKYDTSLADAAYALAARWQEACDAPEKRLFERSDIAQFSSNQIVVFLEKLDSDQTLPKELIELMEKVYGFDSSTNQEIRLRWYSNALKAGLFTQQASKWVSDKGRMKFARPTYRALYKVDSELAQKTFKANENFYHPICRAMLAKDLGLA